MWKKHTESGKSQNPNIGYITKNREVWNKGKKSSIETCDKLRKVMIGKNKGKKLSPAAKLNISNGRKIAIANGTAKRWNTISGNSYPEKYFENVLIELGVSFEKQKKVIGKNKTYFLDFLIENKINLEIDGSQHKQTDRIKSDLVRDEFIKSLGYIVLRIDWRNPNTEEGKSYLLKKITELKGTIV